MKINFIKAVLQIQINHILLVLIALGIGGILALGFKTYLSPINKSNSEIKGAQTESLSPTPIEEVIPSATPTIYIYKAQPTIDPDPIVNCTITNIGVVKIKSSQCSISFACEVGKGNWQLYTSKDKCNQDQANYDSGKQNNPINIPLENAKNNAKYFEVQICINQAKDESDKCGQECRDSSNSSNYSSCWDKCIEILNTKLNACSEKQKQ